MNPASPAFPPAPRIQDAVSQQIIDIVSRIVQTEGAHKVTVRKIISELGVTNRVFYNRFSNCDEVLRIVYREAFIQLRALIKPNYTDADSFYRFCLDAAKDALIRTYDIKIQFSRYIFEHDSISEDNRIWWQNQIRTHYQFAKNHGYLREINPEDLCDTIWILYRGIYADAVSRQLSRAETLHSMTFAFTCVLNGLGANIPL